MPNMFQEAPFQRFFRKNVSVYLLSRTYILQSLPPAFNPPDISNLPGRQIWHGNCDYPWQLDGG